MKIQIRARFTGGVLFEHDADNNSVRITLEAAVSARANLDGANLAGANLAGANLAGANLAGAYLARANLDGAYLAGANPARANLAGANLARANLAGAYLARAVTLIGSRPIFQIGPIGSRCAYLVAYITSAGVRLRAGCFFGAVDEFRASLSLTHGTNNHAEEYNAALVLIEKHAELWGAK